VVKPEKMKVGRPLFLRGNTKHMGAKGEGRGRFISAGG